jgi:hypothetical protein
MIQPTLNDYYDARSGDRAAAAASRLAASRTARQTLAALAALDLALGEFRAAQPESDWTPALTASRGVPVIA